MSTTPMLITDTRGDAGRLLVTPYTGEAEVRRWLYATYGSPPWLRANHEEATSVIEAIETVVGITDGRGAGSQRDRGLRRRRHIRRHHPRPALKPP